MLGRGDVVSVIRPANAASIRVARSLGAGPAELVELLGGLAAVYRYPPAA